MKLETALLRVATFDATGTSSGLHKRALEIHRQTTFWLMAAKKSGITGTEVVSELDGDYERKPQSKARG